MNLNKASISMVLVILLGLSFFSSQTVAQVNGYDLKYGFSFHGLVPETDFHNDELKFSFLFRGLVRYELTTELELGFGAGYGLLTGYDFQKNIWKTSLIPIDLRFIVSPFHVDTFSPYIYAGGGILGWSILTSQTESHAPVDDSGWDPIIPYGIGAEFALTENILMDISGGYTYTFTDELNGYKTSAPGKSYSDGYFDAGIGITFVVGSSESDEDNDGVLKKDEVIIGTDHKNPDSDWDGLNDGEEILKYNSNPLNRDSDNDGLNDHDEIKIYSTNPNNVDTDDDSIDDFEEVSNFKTDPVSNDTDKDKLTDSEEINLYKTNPSKIDSDSDGLSDYFEVTRHYTDPLRDDTDSDGLVDGAEVKIHQTNPLNYDTDGGSVDDKVEIERGTDPNNPADDKIQKATAPVVLEGLTFPSGKAEVTPQSEKALMDVYNTLKAHPDISVELRGYTDNSGSASANLDLSQRRADAVKNWLVAKGIAPARIKAIGFGEANPIADNRTEEGKRLNRRIEFIQMSK
ncbi:MAG: OmpA family protein [Bacteroidota bacterium]